MPTTRVLAATLALAALLAACSPPSGPGGSSAAQNVAVSVSPDAVTVAPGVQQAFAAAVTGTAVTTVTWSVRESAGGRVSTAGLYTAPGSAGVYHVVATSDADPSVSAIATVTVAVAAPPPPVTIAVSPAVSTVAAGGSVTFTAAVGNTSDAAVAWSVVESACGSVSAAGVYTAPPAAATCHVVATSHADPTKTASAAVTVTAPAPAVTIAVSPGTATVAAGASTTFTATVGNSSDTAVTWSVREASCGSVSAGGVYTAPAAAATCHVVATSHADPTKTASATVTVNAPPAAVAITLAPATATVNACQTTTLTATVTGTANTSATWSVTEAGGGTVSGGVYTAPSTAGTYHVVATSQADPTKSASATLTVVEKVLGVAVSPATVTLAPGATGQFTATVTTTCGAVTAVQTVTAPAN